MFSAGCPERMTTLVVMETQEKYALAVAEQSKRMPIKIPWDAYELLKELAAYASRHGWESLGIDRDDPPTQTAVIEEAIKLLASKRKKKKRSKR